jgi:hypothetical protein
MAWLRHVGGGERRIGEGVSKLMSSAADGICPGCGEKFEDCDYLGGTTVMGDWIVLGEGFGAQVTSLDLKWIYWAPGKKTQEGLLRWGKDTLGVEPKKQTAILQPDNVIERLIDAGIVEALKAKVA